MTEITARKIFEEMIVMNSNIEYDKQNKLIIKCRDRYFYEFGDKIDSQIELLELGRVEIHVAINDSWDYIVSELSRD